MLALAPVMKTATDKVSFHSPQHLEGLELVAARYRNRSFPRHAHEEYVIGAMTAGAEILSIAGRQHLVRPGQLILIEPGEAHSNSAADTEPFGYRVIYVPVPLMTKFLRDGGQGRDAAFIRFRETAPYVPTLYQALLRTHETLMRDLSASEQEGVFSAFLADLFLAGQLILCSELGSSERRKARLVREYLEANFREKIPLRRLAEVAEMSAFHLVRVFKREVGLPPATYQTQLKIAEAKRLLRDGNGIAETAAEVGFADQSHLTRQFHRIVGTSPGRYAAQ